MSKNPHTPAATSFQPESQDLPIGWRRLLLPLASFWIVLLTAAIVCAMVGPFWLEALASAESSDWQRQRRQAMWETRLVLAPQGPAAPAVGPLARAVVAERNGRPQAARQALETGSTAPGLAPASP